MTTAPPADGGRRGSSRRSCPAPDEAGPAVAIGVSPQGRPGRGGGKRKPGKRWKPGAFTGGATRIGRHSSPRAERRMRPVLSWRLHSCAFTFAHGAADASRVRRSARPLKRGREVHRTPRTWKHAARTRSHVCQLLPLFDIRIGKRPRSIASIVVHGASASSASSLQRQGHIRRVIHVAGSAYSAGTNQTEHTSE